MGGRRSRHGTALRTWIDASASEKPMVMMGEVEERACPFIAGAGEARAAGRCRRGECGTTSL